MQFGSLSSSSFGHVRRPASAATLALAVWGCLGVKAATPAPAGAAGSIPASTSIGAGSEIPPSLALPLPENPSSSGSDLGPFTSAPREWRLVAGRHWQIVAPAGEPRETTDARENTRGSCPAGMVEIRGQMKQHFLLDELQMQACTRWIDRKWPERCGEYDRDKWLALSKDLPTVPQHFCIDRFEYPNTKDQYPIILVSWFEARDACAGEG